MVWSCGAISARKAAAASSTGRSRCLRGWPIAQEHGCGERGGEEEGDVVEVEEAASSRPRIRPRVRLRLGLELRWLERDGEGDEGEAGPPAVPAEGGAPHQQLGMERGEQQQARARAGAAEERRDLEQEDGEAGVEQQAGKEVHPAEGRQEGVGEVGQQVHAGGVEVGMGGEAKDFGDGRDDDVERGDLVVVEIAHGEQGDGECRGCEYRKAAARARGLDPDFV